MTLRDGYHMGNESRAKGYQPRPMPPARPMALLTPEQCDSLFEYIKHGDADHHAWLKEAVVAWSNGDQPPPVRGAGRKEARIAELEQEVEELKLELMGDNA